jgi:hypothetical protein
VALGEDIGLEVLGFEPLEVLGCEPLAASGAWPLAQPPRSRRAVETATTRDTLERP